MGAGLGNADRVAEWKAAKSTQSPQEIIEEFTNWGGANLQEDELGTHLMGLLPSQSALVDQVFDALASSDRDDVAYYMAAGATEAELKQLASGGAAPLLFRMMRELQDGSTSGDEAVQMERLTRCASPTHAKLKAEEASQGSAVQAGLAAEGATLQSISQGSGDHIYDEYAVTIDKMPDGLTPEDFLSEMASDLNKAVNDGLFDYINMFERRESTPDPALGNVYDIDIAGPDNGSVVLIERTPDHFTFQTVTTSETGTHPEYGSRQFGFDRMADGGVKFYTRGASRPANAAVGLAGRVAQAQGWTAMVTGIGNTIKGRGGTPRAGSITSWTSHQ
jgi:hypothetical protein